MAAVTANNTITFNLTEGLVYGIGQSVAVPIPASFRSVFQSSGTLLDQCNLVYCATLTFVVSTPQTLDLTSLLDIFGVTANFARVRLVAIRNNSTTNGATLAVGSNGTNDWLGLTPGAATTTVTVYPSTAINDGFVIYQMPNTTGAVVGSTNKIIKLNPGTNAFTVDILIAGCNA